MKVYKVKVNGKVYEVQLDEVSEKGGSVEADKKEAAPVSDVKGAGEIKAPIAGKVLSIKVKVGDVIKKGQTVAVIEAMKLENEVPATAEGKVVAIKASEGGQVANGDTLIVLG